MKTKKALLALAMASLLSGCLGGGSGSGSGNEPTGNDESPGNNDGQDADADSSDTPEEADFEVVGYYTPNREHPNDRPLEETVFAAANDDGQAMVIWHELKRGASDPIFRSIRGDLSARQWDDQSLDQTPVIGEPVGVHITEDGETIVVTSVSGDSSLDDGSYSWQHDASSGWQAPMQLSGTKARDVTATDNDALMVFTTDGGIQRYQNGAWQQWSDNQDISWTPLAVKGKHLMWVNWDFDDQVLNIWRTGQDGEAPITKETFPADKGENFKVYPRGAISNDGAATVVWNDGRTLQFTHSPGPGEPFGAGETLLDYRAEDIRMYNWQALADDYGPEGDLFVLSPAGGVENSP